MNIRKSLFVSRFLFAVCALAITASCSLSVEPSPLQGDITVSSSVEDSGFSKTNISGTRISFVEGDEVRLFCEGFNEAKLKNSPANLNLFSGTMQSKGKSGTDSRWYMTYPSTFSLDGSALHASLPMVQNAPFDPSANMMYSNIAVADYDESDIPTASKLKFRMRHMMGLVHISFMCSNPEYRNDVIRSVTLSSASRILSGDFSLDMALLSPSVVFSQYGEKCVKSRFTDGRVLGLDEKHEVYLFVNPREIDDAKFTVTTDRHIFTRMASRAFTPEAESLTDFINPFDLKDFSVKDAGDDPDPEYLDRTVVCWGDSYTDDRNNQGAKANEWRYAIYLEELLKQHDPRWRVISGGIGGDTSIGIPCRQGSEPLYIASSPIRIPTNGSAVNHNGFYRRNGESYTGYSFYGNAYPLEQGQINPCRIEGLDGVTFTVTSSTIKVNAIEDGYSYGEYIDVPAYSRFFTHAATELRHPALIVIYMGTNGGYSTLEQLYSQHRQMIDFAKMPERNSEDYIVLGYHNGKFKLNYANYFDSAECFGINPSITTDDIRKTHSRFVDMFRPLVYYDDTYNYRDMLVRVGAAKSTEDEDISAEDRDYCENRHIWPASYRRATGDYHPGVYGAKAIAFLIYDKMKELGYLDE